MSIGVRLCIGRAALVILCVLSSCGLRTPVRPPEDTAPIVPGLPTVTREDGTVVVRWKRADHSSDGARLEDLAAFVVERQRGSEEIWERVATVDVIDQEKIRRRRDFSYRDAEAGEGSVSYRVHAVCADGQEGPPTPAVPATVPPKPQEAAPAPATPATTPE
jgi:hypothetical protein